MIRVLTLCATLFVALPSVAGLVYRIDSVTTGIAAAKLSGEVRTEGRSMRMELSAGDGRVFRKGSIVIARDNAITVYDPSSKTYFELNLAQLAQSKQFAGLSIAIRNPKLNVRNAAPGGTLLGYPTRKTIVDSSYEVVAEGLGALKVTSTIESWTTDRIAEEASSFLQQQRSGIAELDKLLVAHAAALKGFPLKQISTVTVAGAKTVTTTTVSKLQTRAVSAQELAAPAGYRKVAGPLG